MKKITLFAFAVAALSLASCKKDRTCQCTYTQTGTTNVTSHTEDITYTKIKKADAKYNCDKSTVNSTSTQTNGNVTTTTSSSYVSNCKLK